METQRLLLNGTAHWNTYKERAGEQTDFPNLSCLRLGSSRSQPLGEDTALAFPWQVIPESIRGEAGLGGQARGGK